MQKNSGLIQHPPNDTSLVTEKENIHVTGQNVMANKSKTSKPTRTFGAEINTNISQEPDMSGVCAGVDVVRALHLSNNTSTEENQVQPPPSFLTDESPVEVKKRRRERTTFSKSQINMLQEVFKHSMYPDVNVREQLSKKIGVPESRIQVWFKNRRAKSRKEGSNGQASGGESAEIEYPYQYGKGFNLPTDVSNVCNQPIPMPSRIGYNEHVNHSNIPFNFTVNPGMFNLPTYITPSQNAYPIGQSSRTYDNTNAVMANPHMNPPSQFQSYPQGYFSPGYFNFSIGHFNPQPGNMCLMNGSPYQAPVKYYAPIYRSPSIPTTHE